MLPHDAQPCVWMMAGLLAYRLCDRNYDCDHCPLDAALRGTEPPRVPSPPRTAAPRGGRGRGARRFAASHTWLRPLEGTRLRWGLDAFASELLAHASGVVFPVIHNHLRRGRPALWFRDDDIVIPLRSPVSGVVLKINGAVQENFGLLADDPYGEGWLLEVECDVSVEELPGLLSTTEQSQRVLADRKRLRLEAERCLGTDPQVGPTLPDGGERIVGRTLPERAERLTSLRVALGAGRFRGLVETILD
jgi:glycine cleavage system H protein